MMSAKKLRSLIAKGKFQKSTSGYCQSNIQANFLALPKNFAFSFEKFAKQNSKPIPVLEVIQDSHYSTKLAQGANLLNEIPFYNIIEQGKVVKTVDNIEKYAHQDLTYFLIGCSFSFEKAILQEGISLRHIELKQNVAMYNTNIPLNPVEPFKGSMVVSMRPILKQRVPDVCEITQAYAKMHGSPVHIGSPAMIGIQDIHSPDYGDAVTIQSDEVPVFWACGVTVQYILEQIKIPFAITHKPGFMFISDLEKYE